MASRSKSSAFDDLMDLVSMFPWWLGLTLAPISFILAHAWAASERAEMLAGPAGATGILYMLALLLQYIVPVACVLGALASALRRQQRQSLAAEAARAASTEALRAMDWDEFKEAVAEGLRQRGYRIEEGGTAGTDVGVDLVLQKDREKYLVQCGPWRAPTVGVIVVRELHGVMAASGAVGGFVLTSGRFTEEALAFAMDRNIELMDGVALLELMQVKDRGTAATRVAAPIHEASTAAAAEVTGPVCPRCQGPMVKRAARGDASAAEGFWGCAAFPSCRGTM